MIGRALVFALAAMLLSLVGCGEKVQTMDASARRTDSQPWDVSSAANPGFNAAGWKGGDQAAWDAQIRQRNQAQNDYVR